MTPTVSQITAAVAHAFDVCPANITGPSRQRPFAYPRFAVCALSHEAGHSTPAIGARLGNRDHTSILHGIRRVVEISALDAAYAETIARLRKQFLRGPSITESILHKIRSAA